MRQPPPRPHQPPAPVLPPLPHIPKRKVYTSLPATHVAPKTALAWGNRKPATSKFSRNVAWFSVKIGVRALGAVEARFRGRGGCFGGGGGVGVWVGHVGRAAGVGGDGCGDDGEEGRGCGGEEGRSWDGGQGSGISDWGEMFGGGGGGKDDGFLPVVVWERECERHCGRFGLREMGERSGILKRGNDMDAIILEGDGVFYTLYLP